MVEGSEFEGPEGDKLFKSAAVVLVWKEFGGLGGENSLQASIVSLSRLDASIETVLVSLKNHERRG